MRSIIILNHVKIVKVLHRFTGAYRRNQNMMEKVKYLLTFTGELRLTEVFIPVSPGPGCHDDTRRGINIGERRHQTS